MDQKNMCIREFALHERPRERLRSLGIAALSDAELLALLLGSGTRGQNAVALSAGVIGQLGLRRLSRLSVEELARIPGIGTAKAARIIAGAELGRRAAHTPGKSRLNTARMAIRYCRSVIGHLAQEHVLVVWLNKRHEILGREIVTRGLVDEALLHAREVFRGAIAVNASAVIIAHNHPSGDATPSDADKAVARELSAAGEVLGIPVLDHIVVTARGGRSV